MLSRTGYPIAYLDRPNGQGTIGLHVKLKGQDSKFCGLTCRHVVSHGQKPHESYTVSEDDRQYHVQNGDTEFDKIYYGLKVLKQELEKILEPYQIQHDLWEWYQHDEGKAHLKPSGKDHEKLVSLKKEVAYRKRIFESLRALEDKSCRQIGHLAFHPSFETSASHLGYLKDWALVEMDPEKFIYGPENGVCRQRFWGDSQPHRDQTRACKCWRL